MGTTTIEVYSGTTTDVAYTIQNFPYYNGPTYSEVFLLSSVMIAIVSIRVWQHILPKK